MKSPKLPPHLQPASDPLDARRTLKARDTLRGFDVALKWAQGTTDVEDIEHEWRLLNRFQSSVFVEPVEFFRVDGDSGIMTTRWVDGATFQSFAESASGDLILEVVDSALYGLSLVHRAGYIHNDIRSENLIIVPSPVGFSIKWLDLEWAAAVGQISSSMVVVNDASSRLAEIGNPRSDLEAFGSMLQNCISNAAHLTKPVKNCISEFAGLLCDAHERDKLLSAEDARHLLLDSARSHSVTIGSPIPQTGSPNLIVNRTTSKEWTTALQRWRLSGASTCIRVTGPAGCGKSAFLTWAASNASLDGHPLLNLLEPDRSSRFTDSSQFPASAFGTFCEGGERAAILLVGSNDTTTLAQRIGGTIPPGLLTLVECHGDASPLCDAWMKMFAQHELWEFPEFGAREWLQWINAST